MKIYPTKIVTNAEEEAKKVFGDKRKLIMSQRIEPTKLKSNKIDRFRGVKKMFRF